MTLSDLKDDGDFKLVIADTSCKLKVYMGTNIICNKDLQDIPVALETFYDSTKKPSTLYSLLILYSDSFHCCSFRKYYLLLPELLTTYEIRTSFDIILIRRERYLEVDGIYH